MKKRIIALSTFLFLAAYAQDYSQQDVQRFSAYYSNGMQYLQNNQYSSAIIEFKKVLRVSPYDNTVSEALANTYFARAQYFQKTTKEVKKALNDYKSAYFYAKHWSDNPSSAMLSLANSSLKEINDLEKKLMIGQNPQSRLQNAKISKAQGELASAGYDFELLLNGQYKQQAYENLGNIYKNLNNLSLAMDYFKNAIDIDPKNPKLHFLYGVMLDEAKNYEASMEQYNLALQYGDKSPELLEILENKWTQNIVNNPSSAQNYVNLGAIYQKQGNFQNAKAQYLKAYQLDSSDDTILYNLASLYNQQKNFTEAIEVYDKILLKNPSNTEVLGYKASALKELGRFDEALSVYDKILAINPNIQDIKSLRDDIILNHFTGQKLQNYLISKAQAQPNSYEAQFNCALELHKAKDYALAKTYYKKAQALNPSKEETYINLASIYIDEKNFNLANEMCQKGLLISPSNTQLAQYLKDIKEYGENSLYESAGKLFNEKKYLEAINQYQKIQNQTVDIKMAIASCYWQLGDYQNANNYYIDVLKQDPNNIDALTNSAWAYYQAGNTQEAKQISQRILALDKTNSQAQNLINEIDESQNSALLQRAIEQYEKGEYQASLNTLNSYLAKKSNDEYALYYKGLNYDELKNPKEAIKQYKLLISKKPDFKDAYYSLALDLDNSENYSEAVQNYQKFLDLKQISGEKDEMSDFCTSRIKELNEYLSAIKKSNGK